MIVIIEIANVTFFHANIDHPFLIEFDTLVGTNLLMHFVRYGRHQLDTVGPDTVERLDRITAYLDKTVLHIRIDVFIQVQISLVTFCCYDG